MAALESKLVADAESEKAAAAERRLKSLDQLLHQAVVLRRTLLADAGIVAVGEGAQVAEEDECWAGAGAREKGLVGEERSEGIGEKRATEWELLLKASSRYACRVFCRSSSLPLNSSPETMSPSHLFSSQHSGDGGPLIHGVSL